MDIESFRIFCLEKLGVTEELPFDDSTLCFKVMGKIFAITNIDSFEYVNLKCDPEKALELRYEYEEAIKPGYHMSKKHWNSVYMDGELSDEFIKELITHSYDLVVQKLTKKQKEELREIS
ncbi:MAG: MmcQ/YjbR family DNA-binding protein [Cytophagales bacterium]|nr:MmcQ/YjbR family DNA-binding protein [Cytophagales bacterium]